MKRVINAEFAKTDKAFLDACKKVGIKPSKRQASKWRNKRGSAWKTFKRGE